MSSTGRSSVIVLHAEETTPYAYEIHGLLGRGAFGLVYAARLVGPEGFSRPVALKLLKPAYANLPELNRRLVDEARALARLQHPAFIRVDRLIQLESGWALVMERVDGPDLQRLQGEIPRLPLGPALEIAAITASALHAAWAGQDERGRPLRMLHRDLKPSNVMITAFGQVKICDLGSAAAHHELQATLGGTFGTPDYAAPERFDGREGPEADVYALAVVLYELITGERFGLGSPVREHHEARWREALTVLRARLAEGWADHEPVYDLIRFSLAYDPVVRPPAEAFEAACLAMRARLRDESLRSWAGRVVPPMLQRSMEPVSALQDEDLPTEATDDEQTPTLMDLLPDQIIRV